MNHESCTAHSFAVWAASQLENTDLYYGHGSQDAEDEAFWLASYVAGFGDEDFDDGWDRPITGSQAATGRQILKQRIETRKPLAYLINQIWFAGHRFYIDERALVPRSHIGEWIPEHFTPWLDPDHIGSILDMCCGGGSIGIASALELKHASVVLADLSGDALAVAQQNIDDHELGYRVSTVHSDLFQFVNGQFDLVLCNPPYVSHANMEKLPLEYRYEPEMALVSGDKGLDDIAVILNQVEPFLTENGALILEAGTAAPALENALEGMPLTWLMSASGESVVLLISKQELREHRTLISRLAV